jgi:hypothetical protein
LTATDPDFIMKQIKVMVDGQDRERSIEITATSVEHHLSIVFEEGGGQRSALNFGTLYMGERREYPAFIVNNGPSPASFELKFVPGLKDMNENYQGEDDNFVSPNEAGKELTERVLTAEPLTGTVAAYAQMPVKFICRTKKHEKESGFSDHTKKPESRQGSASHNAPDAKQYSVPPKEEAALAIIRFSDGSDDIKHDDIKVQMMYRACYPEVKINRQIF